MSNQAKEIQSFLETTLNDLQQLNRDSMFSTTNTLDSILIRHYDDKVAYKQELKSIRQPLGMLITSNTDNPSMSWSLNDLKGWYRNLLESMIAEIKMLGLPSKKDIQIDKSVNVSVNQNQSQKQKQEQTQEQILDIFLESIKDELTGKQYKEIQQIREDEPDIEKAKPKILHKLKEFGINVCASILANIVTNPAIWTGII
jgi:hypothetical protein